MVFKEKMAVLHDIEQPCRETNENKQKLLRGVQGGGFPAKNPPGRRRQKGRCPRCLARPPPVIKKHLKSGCVGVCLGQGIKKFKKN